jgi:hypothetical protein
MKAADLIKTLRKITEAQDEFKRVKVRGGGKGNSASSVIVPRKPIMGLGKSALAYEFEEEYRNDPEPPKEKKKIKLSKAFVNNKEDIVEFNNIVKEYINESKLHKGLRRKI